MRVLPLYCLFAFSTAAADAVPVAADDKGCLVYPVGEAKLQARWIGPCKDGFAEGEGMLTWSEKDKVRATYTGAMKQGRYHGVGYVRTDDNFQYEGEYVDGKREGFGISVTSMGTRYDGQWKAGRREGQGKMVYALGGSYEGGWRADKFHGKGKVVYAGGRQAEYDFVDGVWPDKIKGPDKLPQFSVKYDNASNVSIRSEDIAASNLVVPGHVSYTEMSPEQRRTIAAIYPLMDPADEPPYPAAGTKGLMQTLANIRDMGDGDMMVLVTVGPDGKALSLASVGSPNPHTAKVVQYAFMLEKYKPGKCAGTPCTMKYPMRLHFRGDGN